MVYRILAVALIVSAGAFSSVAWAGPRCFGAASMDGCRNKQLDYKLTPSIGFARKSEWGGTGWMRNVSYCNRHKVFVMDGLNACVIGASKQKASKTIALIGDSHSAHWRPGFAAAARLRGWRVISLAESGCDYNLVSQARAKVADAARCLRWRRDIPLWLTKHPEVTAAVFAQVGYDSDYQTEVPSFQAAWSLLPLSISEIVVIRDNPRPHVELYDCIESAQRRGLSLRRACSTLRNKNLLTDYAAVAATEMSTRKATAIDLSNYFCSAKLCYPVIGGSLVYAQGAHQAPVFNKTLAPYLLREIDRSGALTPSAGKSY